MKLNDLREAAKNGKLNPESKAKDIAICPTCKSALLTIRKRIAANFVEVRCQDCGALSAIEGDWDFSRCSLTAKGAAF